MEVDEIKDVYEGKELYEDAQAQTEKPTESQVQQFTHDE